MKIILLDDNVKTTDLVKEYIVSKDYSLTDDITIIAGDITKDEELLNRVKTSNSFVLVISDKVFNDNINYINVDNDRIGSLLDEIVYNLTDKGIISMTLDDYEKVISGKCIAISESDTNKDLLVNRLNEKMGNYNLAGDTVLISVYGSMELNLNEAQTLVDGIREKLANQTIIFSVGTPYEDNRVKVTVITKVNE